VTASNYLLLSVEVACLALAVYGLVGQVGKPAIRLLYRRRRLTQRQAQANRLLVRALALVVGGLLGLLPIWPGWLLPAWGPLLGVVAGSLCWAIHPAVKAVVPRVVGLLPALLSRWAGGPAGVAARMAGGSVTETIDTLEDGP
jgi:hypothetical protein